jgi:hypothetical protein
MDDLAPAPLQRTSDDGGRKSAENFAARRKAVKKVQPAPAQTPDLEPEQAPEPEPDNQLDVLA